jgi:hypothetical protein
MRSLLVFFVGAMCGVVVAFSVLGFAMAREHSMKVLEYDSKQSALFFLADKYKPDGKKPIFVIEGDDEYINGLTMGYRVKSSTIWSFWEVIGSYDEIIAWDSSLNMNKKHFVVRANRTVSEVDSEDLLQIIYNRANSIVIPLSISVRRKDI